MAESAKIIHQALDALEKMEKADVHEKVPKRVKPAKGEVYVAERGAAGTARLLHRGRRHRREPVPREGEEPLLHGHERLPRPGKGMMIADIIALIGSLDVVLGEIDR